MFRGQKNLFNNLLSWTIKEFNITQNDVIAIISSMGFDLTQKNIFCALTTGAKLVLSSDSYYDETKLAGIFNLHQVTFLNSFSGHLKLVVITLQSIFEDK